jgi:hypothetical protein
MQLFTIDKRHYFAFLKVTPIARLLFPSHNQRNIKGTFPLTITNEMQQIVALFALGD